MNNRTRPFPDYIEVLVSRDPSLNSMVYKNIQVGSFLLYDSMNGLTALPYAPDGDWTNHKIALRSREEAITLGNYFDFAVLDAGE